jgi:acetyltransferase-like isoleucine patch superfamily enzyme
VSIGSRSFILRPFKISGRNCVHIGKHTVILSHLSVHAITRYAGLTYQPRIEIGDDVYVGAHAYLTAIDRISIGDGCVLSDYVYITDEIHGMDPRAGPIMQQTLSSKGPVIIGPGSFIGFRAALLPGVTLGEHCVVGANSTVTRSFAAYSMIGGSPAKLLKVFSKEAGEWVRPPNDAAHGDVPRL